MLKADFKKHTLQFKQASGTSRGVLYEKDSWLLRIWDDKNPDICGWGECSIIENLSPDDLETLEEKVEEVCTDISDYFYWINGGLAAYPALQFAVEMALLDLQKGGIQLLFPSTFTRGEVGIPINGLLWMGNYDFMEQQLQEKLKQGFSCVKMKVGAIAATEELRLLQKIRREFPEITLRVDANGAFSADTALERLQEYADLQIHSIEQPIRQGNWREMAQLCEQTPLPIALDEELIGIESTAKKMEMLDAIKPQYIIIKPSLLGGFKASEEWIALAEERNIGWWITSALESNIGLNAIAQWTAQLPTTAQQGLGTGSLYTNNVVSPLEIRGEELWYNTQKSWECF